jgi:transposase InsO family protein
VCHAEFYDNQRLPILEDSFRKAILKYGKPDAVYVDNGKVFISKWFRIACAKLGIRHLNTKAYSPESKGKIERFNATVEEFFLGTVAGEGKQPGRVEPQVQGMAG